MSNHWHRGICKAELTRAKIPTSIAPCWTSKYLLLVMSGFWYHGIFTDFMDRVRDMFVDLEDRNRSLKRFHHLTRISSPSSNMRVHGRRGPIRGRGLLPVIHLGWEWFSSGRHALKRLLSRRGTGSPTIHSAVLVERRMYCV